MAQEEKLYDSLMENIDMFKRIFAEDATLKIRKFQSPHMESITGCVIYIDGMVSSQTLNNNIIRPILSYVPSESTNDVPVLQLLMERIINAGEIMSSEVMEEIMTQILYGASILLLEGKRQALIIGTQGWETRAVSEPGSEKSVIGPREGFTESLMINLSLVRRKIKSPDLKFKFMKIGKKTNTNICLCYVEGAVSQKILDELINRLQGLNLDSVLDSGHIQEMIKDKPLSPFETIGNTERPDVVAGRVLEGRIALLVDGSPFALTLPFLFVEYFQVGEDYYNNYFFASFNRLLRFIGAFLAISIPGIYVSLVTYNQEMIPTPLLLSISAARQTVPLPTVAEAFVMLIVFEVLREAGTRIPAPIGQAVSIVGALVLGQAAVGARVVSAPMVIVVGFTGITTLLSVKMQGAIIVSRFILLSLSSFLGLYGFLFGLLGLIIYLMGIQSFGVSYMLTVGSLKEQDIKDTIFRAPWWHPKLQAPISMTKKRIRKVMR